MYDEVEREVIGMIKNRDIRARSQAKLQEQIEALISKQVEVKSTE